MDPHTLEKLDFDRIRKLLAVQAQSSLGRGLAERIEPSRRVTQVTGWMEQAKQFVRYTEERGLPPFGGIRDVRPAVRRAVPPAKLEPEEFGDLSATLDGVDSVRRYLQPAAEMARQAEAEAKKKTEDKRTQPGAAVPHQVGNTAEGGRATSSGTELVAKLGTRLGDFHVITERINRVIDPRGRVRDDASDRLFRIRQSIIDVREQTREVFARILRQESTLKLLQYPNATFHADRMVLPLKAEQRGRIAGIVHRSSDTGSTIFIEPAEAVELNNRRIDLLQQEKEEINRILWELTHLVHLNQKEILGSLEALAVIDLLTAKIKFARHYRMSFPHINEACKLKLNRARNPILLSLFEETGEGSAAGAPRREVVPIDVRLGDDFDIMMITGPNTGGKTAALKTVGLLALMAQSGLPIPVDEGSSVPVFEDIWIDVGDEQSLQQSLSTFSAHLARLLDILRKARKCTLVLVDELGAGTDPDEGAAIGRAIVEHLRGSNCLAMITTHLGALKALGYDRNRIDNASVMFDMETLKPTYDLRIGEPGNSNAISIAARLGMPKKLVSAAKNHLAGRHRALNKAIAGTLHARREAERARKDADAARQEAAKQTLSALDLAKVLEKKHRDYATWVERVMKLQPGDPIRVRNFDDEGRVLRVRLDKQQASVMFGTLQVDVPLSELIFA